MKLSGATACRAKYLSDQSYLLNRDVFSVSKSLNHTLFNFFGKWLSQDTLLMIAMNQVAEFLAGEGGKDSLDTRKHRLKQSTRAPLREDESFADFLDIFSILVLLDVSDNTLLHKCEEVLASEAADGEPARAACHLVEGHLIETLQEEHLQLSEQFVVLRGDL